MYSDLDIRSIVEEVAARYCRSSSDKTPFIPVGVSNRHIHLSESDLNLLFGEGYRLTRLKDLSQTGQYAARETVTLIGPKGVIENTRILGPSRRHTQVEILASDTYRLGIRAPVRESGDIRSTPGIVVAGPAGVIRLEEGVIIARRHIHMNPEDAVQLNLKDREEVSVAAGGIRGLTFHQVLVRVHASFRLEFHIDMDEANSADIVQGDLVELHKQK